MDADERVVKARSQGKEDTVGLKRPRRITHKAFSLVAHREVAAKARRVEQLSWPQPNMPVCVGPAAPPDVTQLSLPPAAP